jgi:outer membrane protein OmpA-like peptidoglycan-associated protein
MGVRSPNDALASDDDVLGHLGLGVKIKVSEGFALRAEGRVLRAPQAGNQEGTNHFAILLGGSFALGRRTSRPPTAAPAPAPAASIEPAPADTDGDGVVDGADRCPDQPEDRDSFEDEDGCPDGDNDRDQVADAADRCPMEAGTADNRGCPDRDRDGDNVVDRVDNCPDKAGSAANQGCTDRQLVVLDGDKVRLLDPVTFTTDRAEVRRRSLRVLDNLAAVLASHPTLLARVRIAGHTDDRGEADYNKDLSQRRADAVKAYLVSRGIAGDRIEAVGAGEEKPLEPNDSATGRARNRRVEIDIVDTSSMTP